MSLPGLPGSLPPADPQRLALVRSWVRAALDLDDETHIMVTELACTERDCPPVETVFAVLEPGARRQWTVHGPVASLTEADVLRMLH